MLGLADQERIKGFTLDLDTALQENTASWTKLDLVSALADLELASAEDLILPLPQALELLAKRSPDDLPEVIPVVFRYSSCPVRLTPDQVSELATLLRREGAEILKAQYGVDVDLDRFRPIMCTGHGGTTAMEFLRNEKWSPPEASFLRWLREVDAGQHKYAVVIGASTVATPSTLLLIARGLGPHGIVTFADSEKAPVTLRAVELASSLTQAVEEIGKLPKPQPGTYADIGRFALAVGEVIDALEDSSATSAVAARTRVALTCFVSRFLGSAYAASHAIDNTAHRWIANGASAGHSASVLGLEGALTLSASSHPRLDSRQEERLGHAHRGGRRRARRRRGGTGRRRGGAEQGRLNARRRQVARASRFGRIAGQVLGVWRRLCGHEGSM